jgi:hypothetical protein
MKAAVHFVRFKPFDQRYWNAVRVFGPPDFMHRRWDHRAQREIADYDTIIYAKGDEAQPIAPNAWDDSADYASNGEPDEQFDTDAEAKWTQLYNSQTLNRGCYELRI